MDFEEFAAQSGITDPGLKETLKSRYAGITDWAKVKVNVAFKLEKYDGHYAPNKAPVETIEGHETYAPDHHRP